MGEGQLAPAPEGFGLSIARKPEQILGEAQAAARALKDIISKKTKPVIMNGEQYLEFEDWQTVGAFYRVTTKVVSTEPVEISGALGFIAKAVAVSMDTGQEISGAEAMCLNDEDNWSVRAKYAWEGEGNNRKRVKIGEEKVPLFQLRSMAQTRACAKSLRNIFGWVVVLAGYKPTVAEELTETQVEGSRGKIEPSKSKSEQAAGAPEADAVQLATIAVSAVTDKVVAKKDGTDGLKFVIRGEKEGEKFETWSEAFLDVAKKAKESKKQLVVGFVASKWGNEVKSASLKD